ncbi:hypothetical protein FQN60_012497 [Etheostoma spectabile]|uniref:Uncharacterized protein n=1 Tax=Etheostoma spectabile TaxID=54343 RepID=A0A5J5DQ16_9PERO|nr:hypothetical protein FQN60_012497 [Etheostoma spectabile]
MPAALEQKPTEASPARSHSCTSASPSPRPPSCTSVSIRLDPAVYPTIYSLPGVDPLLVTS